MYSCVKQVLVSERLRHFSLTVAINKSHYDSLGVTRKATNNEIKNAYYKLSKVYHPDKNKGSDEAAHKFHDITAAYEVLGNIKLRKLYDKGLLHTAGSEFSSCYTETEPENKFYKSREQRARPPAPAGKTDVYNFDEWTRAHYSETFERTKIDRSKNMIKNEILILSKYAFQAEMFFCGFIVVVIVFISLFRGSENFDAPAEKKKINPDT